MRDTTDLKVLGAEVGLVLEEAVSLYVAVTLLTRHCCAVVLSEKNPIFESMCSSLFTLQVCRVLDTPPFAACKHRATAEYMRTCGLHNVWYARYPVPGYHLVKGQNIMQE